MLAKARGGALPATHLQFLLCLPVRSTEALPGKSVTDKPCAPARGCLVVTVATVLCIDDVVGGLVRQPLGTQDAGTGTGYCGV